ncbi:MAG TPA: hypothetical protein VJ184_01565, partial [Chryseolinea sp.]|nr:hypothetical protein [Chryseolinea sp.]
MNIRPYTSPNSPKSTSLNLTRLYIAALTTVAILVILGQMLIQRSINNQLSDSRVVNLAGKQRFKSQEISKLVLLIQYNYNHPDYSDKARSLDSLLTTWEMEHLGLKHGS